MENRLKGETLSTRKDFLYFLEIGRVLTSTLQLDELLSLATDMALDFFSAEVGALKIFVPEEKTINFGFDLKDLASIKKKNHTVRDIITELQEFVFLNPENISREYILPGELKGRINSMMAGPLVHKGEVLGYMVLVNKRTPETEESDSFTEDEFEKFVLFVQQMAVAVANARAYEEVARLKTFYEHLFNSLSEGVITVDEELRINKHNIQADSILNSDLEKKNIKDIFPHSVCEKIEAVIRGSECIRSFEETMPDKRILRFTISPLIGKKSNQGAVVTFEDITGLKKLEAQVRRAEKLASLGELAAGLAHEIKNPITALKGYAQLLDPENPDEEFLKEMKETMLMEVSRVNSIVNALLSFARPKIHGKAAINLNEVVERAVKLLEIEASRNDVELNFISKSDPTIFVDPGALEQVIINVGLNAIQAVTEDPPGDTKPEVVIITDSDENSALITIEDNGPGIPESIRERIFDPFFTTKKTGTGLGLAITHRIIDELGGTIQFESMFLDSPGGRRRGTRFIISLPKPRSINGD